jgi:RNA recognition motif-containing protein
MVKVKIIKKIESNEETFSVYVSNINLKKETNEEEIQKHFESCGKILKIEKNEPVTIIMRIKQPRIHYPQQKFILIPWSLSETH